MLFSASAFASIPQRRSIVARAACYSRYYHNSTAASLSSRRYTITAAASTSTTSSLSTKMTHVKFRQIVPKPASNANSQPSSSSSSPLPRSSHGLSIIQNGTLLVLFGGEHIARTPIEETSQSLWIAKKKSKNDWQWVVPTITSSEVPPLRVAHAQAAVGDTIYVFGGRSGIDMGENALNDLWMLHVDSDATTTADTDTIQAKWTQINAALTNNNDQIPEARSFHKMIAVGTSIYMFGGCGANGRLNDLWKFDTLTNKWTELGASHVLRGRGGPNILSLAGDRIAVVAGFAGEETNDGHVYNCHAGAWEEKSLEGLEKMRPRSVCCFASLPGVNKCIIFGGEVDPSQKGHEGAGGFERDVVVVDGTSGSVIETIQSNDEEEWPHNRGWADAAVHEDTFYMFGGLAGDDSSPIRLDDLWQCKVSP